ncbi:hypothetical protein ACP8Y2_19075 [Herpetosiphon llansteffanensis]
MQRSVIRLLGMIVGLVVLSGMIIGGVAFIRDRQPDLPLVDLRWSHSYPIASEAMSLLASATRIRVYRNGTVIYLFADQDGTQWQQRTLDAAALQQLQEEVLEAKTLLCQENLSLGNPEIPSHGGEITAILTLATDTQDCTIQLFLPFASQRTGLDKTGQQRVFQVQDVLDSLEELYKTKGQPYQPEAITLHMFTIIDGTYRKWPFSIPLDTSNPTIVRGGEAAAILSFVGDTTFVTDDTRYVEVLALPIFPETSP